MADPWLGRVIADPLGGVKRDLPLARHPHPEERPEGRVPKDAPPQRAN